MSVCLSVLSVAFVHCGQTVGRIKMKLASALATLCKMGTKLPSPKGAQPPPNFRPISVAVNRSTRHTVNSSLFLANVNVSSRSLYAIARPSLVCDLTVCLSVVCRLSSVTLVRPTQAAVAARGRLPPGANVCVAALIPQSDLQLIFLWLQRWYWCGL